jgi:hypothetical protein
MSSSPEIRLDKFVKSMRGTYLPVLAQASDGHCYIVKLGHSAHRMDLAFNESAGSELFAACGLQVPAWRPVEVTREFLLQAKAGLASVAGMSSDFCEPGLIFGSRWLGSSSQRIYQILSAADFSRIRDRRSFWTAWLVDLCAEQTSRRQALFVEDGAQQLDPYFVDHGSLFRGVSRDGLPDSACGRYHDPRIYEPLSAAEAAGIVSKLMSVDLDTLRKQIDGLPGDWRRPESIGAFEAALERIASGSVLQQWLLSISRVC